MIELWLDENDGEVVRTDSENGNTEVMVASSLSLIANDVRKVGGIIEEFNPRRWKNVTKTYGFDRLYQKLTK